MTTAEQHAFLKDLDKRLWDTACKLLPSLDAAVYKHVVLGLVFLKYVGDSFFQRQEELRRQFADPKHEYYLGEDAADAEMLREELEERDYYTEANVFWVPEPGRWHTLMECIKLNPGEQLPWGKEFRGADILVDDAMEAIEKDNPKLKGVLNKNYAQLQLGSGKLAEVMDLINSIPFEVDGLKAKDILGHVYEYFLGQFASAEGKKGGQYYTPKSIVTLIVEMLRPYKGRVYDPACGSGGFFVSSEDFVEAHGGNTSNISVYGQESNPTTWRLAAMNMAIRGIEYDFGKEPADTFHNNQHPDKRFDYIMANPPFNLGGWGADRLADDPRWKKYGIPPESNANFAWMQHMIHHLNPKGKMALLLANGSMSSASNGEGDIRRRIVEADLVECIVALPGQLFTNTQIPACIWFLNRDKSNGREIETLRNRSREVLFIDARNCGYMVDRVLRTFDKEDMDRIAQTLLRWQMGDKAATPYADEPGFCASVTLDRIKEFDYVLTPGRYVGAPEAEDDGIPFEEKMAELTATLFTQMEEGQRLDAVIRVNLKGLGYAC